MALNRVKHWAVGEVLTANDLNNEFDHILQNGQALVTPWTGTFDLNGNTLILDGDADTSVDAAVDDTIDVTISGADDFRLTANTLTALSGSSIVVENGNITSTVGNLTITDGQTTLADPGSHTNTVVTPLIVESTTSGTPAANIGTGILFKSESQDENPSNVGQAEFAFSDISTGSEDSYFQILLRVAGAALTACYRFVATGAFRGIFTHANTADRTYTLPNWNTFVTDGTITSGPRSAGSGSSLTFTTWSDSNGNVSKTIFVNGPLTISNGVTKTVPTGAKYVVLYSTDSITINGTLTAQGAGGAGGTSSATPTAGEDGTDQTGGTGGGGDGGANGAAGGEAKTAVLIPSDLVLQAASAPTGYPSGAPATPASVAAIDQPLLFRPEWSRGGGGGGAGFDGGVGSPTGHGGKGGGTIVLIAPSVTIGASGIINTKGENGADGTSSGSGDDPGGGGGGAGGNLYIFCNTFSNSGTIQQTGGTGGGGAASGSGSGSTNGGNGANGITQINIYGS